MSTAPRTVVVNRRWNDFDVWVGRAWRDSDGRYWPGTFGNQWRVGEHGDLATVLRRYEGWLDEKLRTDVAFARAFAVLAGKRLACACRPRSGFGGRLRCHAQLIAGRLDGVDPRLVG